MIVINDNSVGLCGRALGVRERGKSRKVFISAELGRAQRQVRRWPFYWLFVILMAVPTEGGAGLG